MQVLRKDTCPVLFPMAQATSPGHPRLPCSPKQALTLYQLLFQRPADQGQLQTALQQVHEAQGCPPGLELPMMLLEMEQSRWAQEKLLWDLELLTGVGLGLFWPPWAGFCSQRDQTQHARNQCSQSWHRTLDGDCERLSSKLNPPPQVGEALLENHHLLKGGQATSDPNEARSDEDPRLEGPVIPTEATPGTPTGDGQEVKGATAPGSGCLHPTSSSSLKEPGNAEFKDPGDPGKVEERSQAEPSIQSSDGQALRSPQEEKPGQEGPEPLCLASHGLPALQDRSKGPGSGLSKDRPAPQTPLTNSPQSHPEETPQVQRGQSPQGYKGESIGGQDEAALQSQRERKRAQQGQELKTPRFREYSNSEFSGEVQGEATEWRQKEGNPQGHSRDLCRSPGKPIPQCVEKRIPGPQLTQSVATKEGVWAPLPAEPPALPRLHHSPEGGILASGAQERQRRFPGARREQSRPGDPKSSKAARPVPGSREEVLVSAEQEALQRLLDLYRAARQRRRRDQEQQQLRVLERLRILANHHRRVHPLGFPSNAAQIPPQDAAGRRRILRELLEQVCRGRTQQLRALGSRNIQNFQDLLSPDTEKPTPGE